MDFPFLSFSQEQVTKTKLNVTDLIILDYVYKHCESPLSDHKVAEDGTIMTWVNHSKFIKEMPVLRITKKTFENRISHLKSLDI